MGHFDRPFIFYPTHPSLEIIIMKAAQIFGQLSATHPNKYIPTPQAATIILNFFIYNNFQDFNTWQQLARTRIQYEYFENSKAAHICKVVLKWEDRTLPTFMESAQAKNKKSAKRRALKRLIESIIHQGYIALGFKEENFVEKLPRRRKNESDDSQEDISQEKYTERPVFLNLLKQGRYEETFRILANNDPKWKPKQLMESWRHGLSIKSVSFLQKVIQAYRGAQVTFTSLPPSDKFKVCSLPTILPRQFSNVKQVNSPLQEELTDFIRYSQLQKAFISPHPPLRQPELTIRPIPSQLILQEMRSPIASRQQLTSLFHPIEGRKIFLSLYNQAKEQSEENAVELPRFQKEERELTIKMVEEMYGMLPYYCLDYGFVEEVVKMMREEIKSVEIVYQQTVETKDQEKGGEYYLNMKNLLTAQFCHLIHGKFLSSFNNVTIEGMVVPFKHEDQAFIFNYKQPQEIVARKINRRANLNEFDEMQEISINQMVALISKIDRSVVYFGQILELSPAIKLYVPQLSDEDNDPQPFTMVRIYNSKIYEKTSSSIIKVAKSCMKLLREKTTIIWQPPSFPILSVLSQLLVEWLTIKATVLIVSLDSQALHTQLTNLGFKIAKITQRTEQKSITKCNVVVASPSVVCCELLKNYAYSRVVIEGAHQVSEMSCLSAIVKGCQELYLIGDPYMPRMAVGSPYCRKNGMGISLIERLYKQGVKTQTFFSRLENCCEFRNVMEWADRYLYNRKLMLIGNQHQTPLIKGFPWPSIDYRVCFLHHPNRYSDEGMYLEEQAYICSIICGQVAKSGYTKLQEITCSAATGKCLPFLQKYMGILLKELNYAQAKIFKKYMGILCRIVAGSVYFRSDLSILMLGNERQEIGFREIVGALREGRRGVIIIGDMEYFRGNEQMANFIDWCREKKLINRVDGPVINKKTQA